MRHFFSFMVFGLLIILGSCQKDNLNLDYTTIQTPELGSINAINKIDSGWIISGGNKGETGFILTSDNDLKHYKTITDSLQWPVYDQIYSDNRFVFSTDHAAVYTKKPELIYLQYYVSPEEFWVNTLNKKKLWQIEETPNMGNYIAGGGEYNKGLIYYSPVNEDYWMPYELNNEMRSVSYQPPNTIWACGYGLLIKTHDFISGWQIVPFKNEFYTGIDFLNENVGLLATFGGRIYRTSNGGEKWNEVSKIKGSPGRLSINKIRFINSTMAVAIGNGGYIAISNDGGLTWESGVKFNDTNLHDMAYFDGRLYLVGNTNEIFRILL